MKKASTLISVIIAIVMLLAALGVGFSVKQFRAHRAEKAVEAKAEPKVRQSGEKVALPGGGERRRSADLTAEQRAERQEERAQMRDRWENMSEEERRQFMAERGDRFDAARQQGGGRRPGGMGMSEEERQAMRERFENMSEEERQKAREEMRQRFGGRRRGDRGGPDRRPPDREPMRTDEGTREENPDNPPEN